MSSVFLDKNRTNKQHCLPPSKAPQRLWINYSKEILKLSPKLISFPYLYHRAFFSVVLVVPPSLPLQSETEYLEVKVANTALEVHWYISLELGDWKLQEVISGKSIDRAFFFSQDSFHNLAGVEGHAKERGYHEYLENIQIKWIYFEFLPIKWSSCIFHIISSVNNSSLLLLTWTFQHMSDQWSTVLSFWMVNTWKTSWWE